MKILFHAILLLVLLLSSVQADSLKCTRTGPFIRQGDSKYTVLQACGEPLYKDVVSGADNVKIDQWTYKNSWSNRARIVVFTGGRVSRIERAD